MTTVQDEGAQYVAWSNDLEFRCLEGNDGFRTHYCSDLIETDGRIE